MTAPKFDYIAEANVTASNTYHGDNVPASMLKDVMENSIRTLKHLDVIKKSLFYGRKLPDEMMAAYMQYNLSDSARFPKWISDDEAKGTLILHSIIGQATEVCEQLELLFATLFQNAPFDMVNFCEEIGDSQWYEAIGLGAVGETFDSVQRRNIAKLRHRFPNKFTEYDANNRDLFGERKILEEATPAKVAPELSKPITREQIGS